MSHESGCMQPHRGHEQEKHLQHSPCEHTVAPRMWLLDLVDGVPVPRSIPGLPSGTQEYTRTASRAEAESEVPLRRVGGAQLQSL